MVNSGAIMSASILLYRVKPEMNVVQKYDYVHRFFKVSYVGRKKGKLSSHFFDDSYKRSWPARGRVNSIYLFSPQEMAGGEYLGFNNSIFLSEVRACAFIVILKSNAN